MTKQEYYDLLVEKALDGTMPGKNPDAVTCSYLTETGHKCAIGILLPDGHPGQYWGLSVTSLLNNYPDLEQYMPQGLFYSDLKQIQQTHDETAQRHSKEHFAEQFIARINELECFEDVRKQPVPKV